MIVSDASPLINLAKARKLHLLKDLFGKVLIEEEVKLETIDRGKDEGAQDAELIEDALNEGWIVVHKIKNTKIIQGIHQGESNSILLARKHNCMILIDEEDGRDVAKAMGLEVKGTLYILKKSVEKGIISKQESIQALNEMMVDGFRISARIYAKFLEGLEIKYHS
jgi:predicted nucleic acid-binding protein